MPGPAFDEDLTRTDVMERSKHEHIATAMLLGCQPVRVGSNENAAVHAFYALPLSYTRPYAYGNSLKEVCADWLYVNGYRDLLDGHKT